MSCEKDTNLSNPGSLTSTHTQRHYSSGDFAIVNGRLVFTDWASWVDVMNGWNYSDSVTIFKEMITSLGGDFSPFEDYDTYFTADTSDHMEFYFLNKDKLFQVDTTIFYVDFNHWEVRGISENDEGSLMDDLIAGNSNPGIRVAEMPFDNPSTQRPYAACSYCALGAIALGFGCPAGLLELYACYYCWANW